MGINKDRIKTNAVFFVDGYRDNMETAVYSFEEAVKAMVPLRQYNAILGGDTGYFKIVKIGQNLYKYSEGVKVFARKYGAIQNSVVKSSSTELFTTVPILKTFNDILISSGYTAPTKAKGISTSRKTGGISFTYSKERASKVPGCKWVMIATISEFKQDTNSIADVTVDATFITPDGEYQNNEIKEARVNGTLIFTKDLQSQWVSGWRYARTDDLVKNVNMVFTGMPPERYSFEDVKKFLKSSWDYLSAMEDTFLIDTSKKWMIDKDGVLHQYYSQEREETITIPEGVKIIGARLFSDVFCRNIMFPKSLVMIQGQAFHQNEFLTTITFSKETESLYIGNEAFYGCSSLNKFDFPTCPIQIGEAAFTDCRLLNKIFIPSTVSEVGVHAFALGGRFSSRGDGESLDIYCEAKQRPDGWDERFLGYNYNNTQPLVTAHWGSKPGVMESLKEEYTDDEVDLEAVDPEAEAKKGSQQFEASFINKAGTLGADIDFHQIIYPNRHDPVWYEGTIATITYEDIVIKVETVGESRIMVEGEKCYNASDLEEHGIFSDEQLRDIEDQGSLERLNNSWYTFIIYGVVDGQRTAPIYDDDMGYDVTFDLHEALNIEFYINDVIPDFRERYFNNRDGAGIKESKMDLSGKPSKNELKKMAKRNKKTDKKGTKGYFVNLNAGNVEHNIVRFNHIANGGPVAQVQAAGPAGGGGMAPAGLGESVGCGLIEKIEKHDTLNPKLWEGNDLKPQVKEKIHQIVDEFIKGLEKDAIKIKVKDIILIGSNCSYNYNDESDLDIHIIADTQSLECPSELYPLIYSAYRSIFNKKYEIDFYGIGVEVFVETEETKTVSNGIYSVNTGWIKEPVKEDIPEVDMAKFDKEFTKWEDRYFEIIKGEDISGEEAIQDVNESLEEDKIKDIDEFTEDIYDLRKISLQKDGEYSIGNLVFKELRSLGYLDILKSLKNQLKSKELSLEGLNEAPDRFGLQTDDELEKEFKDKKELTHKRRANVEVVERDFLLKNGKFIKETLSKLNALIPEESKDDFVKKQRIIIPNNHELNPYNDSISLEFQYKYDTDKLSYISLIYAEYETVARTDGDSIQVNLDNEHDDNHMRVITAINTFDAILPQLIKKVKPYIEEPVDIEINEAIAVKTDLTKEVINSLAKKVDVDGTYTVDEKGNPNLANPTSGYQVSFFRPEITDSDIKLILDVIGNSFGELYLGLFQGTGEISYTLESSMAKEVARIFNQESVWDNKAGEPLANRYYSGSKKVNYKKAAKELTDLLGK